MLYALKYFRIIIILLSSFHAEHIWIFFLHSLETWLRIVDLLCSPVYWQLVWADAAAAAAAVTAEAFWCFLWAYLLTPLQLLLELGSLWRSSSGTEAQELDCLLLTVESPVEAAAAVAVAVVVSAEFGGILADCLWSLYQRSQGGGSCSVDAPLEAWQWLER